MLWFDLRTYLPSLLARLDKASMAAAVECRVPFLDNEMIDLSLRVPAHLKIQVGRENKVALKQIAAEVLPNDLVYRRKVGFGTPLADWFRHERGLGRYLELVLDRSARIADFADRGRIASLVEAHRRSDADHSEIIWSLVAFELWCRTIVDAAPADEDSRVTEHTWRDELTRLRQLDPRVADAAAVHSGVVV